MKMCKKYKKLTTDAEVYAYFNVKQNSKEEIDSFVNKKTEGNGFSSGKFKKPKGP